MRLPPVIRSLLGPIGRIADRRAIRRSGLFDSEYYAANNLDLVKRRRNLLDHYAAIGWRERRRPSAEFDIASYFALNPDLIEADREPIQHYDQWGRAEGRRTVRCCLTRAERPEALRKLAESGFFNAEFYLNQIPVLDGLGIDPLFHYLVSGYKKFLEPSPHLSMQAYVAANPELRRFDHNPLLHYIDRACPEGFGMPLAADRPGWIFDTKTRDLPDAAANGERMAGGAFLSRFGPVRQHVAHLDEGIEAVWSLTPLLSISDSEPDGSIIVSHVGPDHLLLSCLDSLARHQCRRSVEVLIIGPRPRLVANAPSWLRFVECEGGLATLQRRGASEAKGKTLLFIDGGMRVAHGCLDAIFDLFDGSDPAKIVIPKTIHDDGQPLSFDHSHVRPTPGAGNSSNHPDRCCVRRLEPQEISDRLVGCAVALCRSVALELLGEDGVSAGGTHVKSNLSASLQIWQQTFAWIVAYDGQSGAAPFDRQIGLGSPAMARRIESLCQAPPQRPRLIVLDSFTPKPDQDSGSFITAKMLAAFQELGYAITFVPEHSYAFEGPYTQELQRKGIRCLYAPYFETFKSVAVEPAEAPFDVVLAYRYEVMEHIIGFVRRYWPHARMLFHNVDLHYLREKRQAELVGDPIGIAEATRTQKRELGMIAEADCAIVHTPTEKAIIAEHMPVDHIMEFPYIAETHETTSGFAERRDIMFLGGFAHRPNVDAVTFFVRKVWPTLMATLPADASLLLVGAAPDEEVRTLAGPRIIVTGTVPDLAPWFERARVFVAPLRYGAGIKGKLIQSMAYGVPAVATTIAAEGIGLQSGKETLIADDADEMASAAIALYNDHEVWQAMQAAGIAFVAEHYSWRRCLELCRLSLDIADKTWHRRNHFTRIEAEARPASQARSTADSAEVR